MADPMQNERGGSAVNAMIDQEPAGEAPKAAPAQSAAASVPPQAAPQRAPAGEVPAAAAPATASQAGGQQADASPPASAQAQSVAAMALFDTGRIQSIKVKVQAMLGGATLTVSQLSELKQGDTVSLNSKIGDPVQILANGQLIGHGQLVIVESDPPSFGIWLESIVDNG